MSELMKKASRVRKSSGTKGHFDVKACKSGDQGYYEHLYGPLEGFAQQDLTSFKQSVVPKQSKTWKDLAQKQNETILVLSKKIKELEEKLSAYERTNESFHAVNEIKEHYLNEMVQSTEFGQLLNCTRQNINRLRREHKLLAVSGKNGNYYPKWQLDSENCLYRCIPQVIDALGFDNQWTTVQFFHTVFERLGNVTPIQYLRSHPSDQEEVPRLARQYLEQTCS
ncbi:hypothetical protein BOO22_14665 [Vibrio cidicii]|uniref:hypothetical protein n=1 Tax=Vibrio cidicii TaxID=1763883 RepID=UPI0018C2D892|nr:hypothetical protein [Vibrio cidicii]MBG0760654.1 hypothetical protein [Vibrio cidicii]